MYDSPSGRDLPEKHSLLAFLTLGLISWPSWNQEIISGTRPALFRRFRRYPGSSRETYKGWQVTSFIFNTIIPTHQQQPHLNSSQETHQALEPAHPLGYRHHSHADLPVLIPPRGSKRATCEQRWLTHMARRPGGRSRVTLSSLSEAPAHEEWRQFAQAAPGGRRDHQAVMVCIPRSSRIDFYDRQLKIRSAGD